MFLDVLILIGLFLILLLTVLFIFIFMLPFCIIFCLLHLLFLQFLYVLFLVSGCNLACQQEVSLALTKTPPIHYYNVVDSAFSNYAE